VQVKTEPQPPAAPLQSFQQISNALNPRVFKPPGYPMSNFASNFSNGPSELLGYRDPFPNFYIPSPKRLREKFNYT
jgi:hypothetical protein